MVWCVCQQRRLYIGVVCDVCTAHRVGRTAVWHMRLWCLARVHHGAVGCTVLGLVAVCWVLHHRLRAEVHEVMVSACVAANHFKMMQQVKWCCALLSANMQLSIVLNKTRASRSLVEGGACG